MHIYLFFLDCLFPACMFVYLSLSLPIFLIFTLIILLWRLNHEFLLVQEQICHQKYQSQQNFYTQIRFKISNYEKQV